MIDDVGGYEVEVVELSGKPLPANRPRLFFLGVSKLVTSFSSSQWAQAGVS